MPINNEKNDTYLKWYLEWTITITTYTFLNGLLEYIKEFIFLSMSRYS